MQEQEIEAPQTRQNSCNNVFPWDMVCLGNMCVDTLHKGDDDDDDDDDDNNNNNNIACRILGLVTCCGHINSPEVFRVFSLGFVSHTVDT